MNAIGKWKTATQMVALSLLIAVCGDGAAATARGVQALTGAAPAAAAAGVVAATRLGVALLWASAGLALWSLWVYMAAGLPLLLRKK